MFYHPLSSYSMQSMTALETDIKIYSFIEEITIENIGQLQILILRDIMANDYDNNILMFTFESVMIFLPTKYQSAGGEKQGRR